MAGVNWNDIGVVGITSQNAFGTAIPPRGTASRTRSAPKKLRLDVNAPRYMGSNGPGRFALPSMASGIGLFVGRNANLADMAPGTYTKADLVDVLVARGEQRDRAGRRFEIEFQHRQYGVNDADYGKRVYIEGGVVHEFDPAMRLVVTIVNGRKVAEFIDLKVLAPRGNNFDRKSDSATTAYGNRQLNNLLGVHAADNRIDFI
jgi:hypothetical protein